MSSCHKRRDAILKRAWGRQVTGALDARVTCYPIIARRSTKRGFGGRYWLAIDSQTEALRSGEESHHSSLTARPDRHDQKD